MKKFTGNTDWEALQTMEEKEIDYSDNPATDENFWKNTELVILQKKAISIRLDQDVFDWFKQQGRGYQSRMNAVLRLYMENKKTITQTKNET